MDLEKIAIAGYRFQNWSRTYECQPELLFIPETIDEIREILYLAKTERKRIRVVGCGNSPSDLCCSDDYLIDMSKFNNVLHIDHEQMIVHVQGGINLSLLNEILEKNDLALPVLGSISDSTLAGVISVGTHGTGFQTGIIADYVLSIRLITPNGDIMVCSKQPDEQPEVFYSVLCGLGSLGVILQVSIQCQRKFYLHQLTYPSLLETVLERLDENVESCDHFRFLFFPHTDYVSVSITNRVNGAFLNLNKLQLPSSTSSIERKISSSTCSSFDLDEYDQMELTNPYGLKLTKYRCSSERTILERVINWIVNYGVGYHFIQFAYYLSSYWPPLVPLINKFAFWFLYSSNQVQLDISHKVFNFECLFDQHVNEWSIPRNKTAQVLRELKQMIEYNAKCSKFYAHFPIEVRFVRQSPIYLAPSYGRDSTYINIICYRPYGKQSMDHIEYWNQYEDIMKRHGGRPHWAKDHRETAVDLVRMYPYFRLWCQIRKRLDPNRLFFNSYMDRIFSTFPTTTIAANNNNNSMISGNYHNNKHFNNSNSFFNTSNDVGDNSSSSSSNYQQQQQRHSSPLTTLHNITFNDSTVDKTDQSNVDEQSSIIVQETASDEEQKTSIIEDFDADIYDNNEIDDAQQKNSSEKES